jgi:alkanesulfonate monooxygenase SsuD/methylene tetrahydromethanopterin reductase-like flavin-dependent oxidoreductase (luciferase family)
VTPNAAATTSSSPPTTSGRLVTGDRRGAAERAAAERFPYLSPAEVLDTPFLLIGTVEEIAQQLLERRDRYGFTFITVHEPYMAEFAPVIERVRA